MSPPALKPPPLLLRQILWAMVLAVVAVIAMSFLEPGNDLRVTLVLYLPVLLALGGLGGLVWRGHHGAAAWGATGLFFVLICTGLLLMGGLRAHNAVPFVLGVMIAGALLGGRAALQMALLSSAFGGLVLILQLQHLLPPPMAVSSPINGWVSITISLILSALLLKQTLDSLQDALRAAEERAHERDAANARFLTTQKMEIVGQLSGGVAHDFNNLLTVVTTSVGMLELDLPDDAEEARSLLADITAATTRAELLTRRLLTFSRAHHSDELVPVDVSRLLRGLGPMLPRLLSSNIRITVDATDRAVILADRAGLEQIVLNLVINAREAMPQGGRLTLHAGTQGREAVLTVTDSGVGMDEDTRARIFEPFFTTKRTGTGLGLATVQELVRRFSGQIAIETAPDRGCRFTLTFPRSHASPSAAPEGEITSQPGLRPQVLLVDDDPLVRRATARMLTIDNVDVTAVASAEAALALLGSRPDSYDLIITDLVMPNLSGDLLAARLDEQGSDLPILFISGHQEHDLPADLSFPTAFLPKPYDRRALSRAIHQLLGLP